MPIDTVARFERADEFTERTVQALQLALKSAGVEFTNGDQPGVHLTKAAAACSAVPAGASEATASAKALRRKGGETADKPR